jgi:hypothetical protein
MYVPWHYQACGRAQLLVGVLCCGDFRNKLQALQQMMEDMKDPEFQRVLNETLTQLTTTGGAPAPASDSASISATAAATLFSTLSAGDGVSSSDSLMKTLEVRTIVSLEALSYQLSRSLVTRRCYNG